MKTQLINKPLLALVAFLFCIQFYLFINTSFIYPKSVIEIPAYNHNNNKDSIVNNSSNKAILVQGSKVLVKNNSFFDNLIYNTETNSPSSYLFSCSICVIVFFLLLRIKRKGFYKVDISKELNALAMALFSYAIFLSLQSIMIRNIIESTSQEAYSFFTDRNTSAFFYMGILVAYFNNLYKKNVELNKQQDLTI